MARRPELGVDESPDPHVERLIESFAFLTAEHHHGAAHPSMPGGAGPATCDFDRRHHFQIGNGMEGRHVHHS